MLGGPNPSLVSLTHIFNENAFAITSAMTRIASGKRVQSPSDDFIGFLKAATYNTEISQYQTLKQDQQDAKGLTDYAVSVGNSVVESVKKLHDLKDLYDAADAETKPTYAAQYAGVYSALSTLVGSAKYDGHLVYTNNSVLATVVLDPTGTSFTVNVNQASAFDDPNMADIDNLSDITTVVLTNLDNAIAGSENYVSFMQAFSDQVAQHLKLTDSIISSKQAVVSVIMDIDEVAEMTALTSLQIRQQATVAMMAQATETLKYGAKLYE
jgi:flagellin-like hook-associated protein FlgL